MTLAVGTKVKVRSFEGRVVPKESMSGLGLTHLDNGFVAVEDEEGLIHALWWEGSVTTETSVLQVAEVFEEGEVVKDDYGVHYQFMPDYGSPGTWLQFGVSTRYGFDIPKRPLTRLGS
jgi:hypothetical protein